MEKELDYLSYTPKGAIPNTAIQVENLVIQILDLGKLSIRIIDWDLELRSFQQWDELTLLENANNAHISKNFIGFPHPYTEGDAKKWILDNSELNQDGIRLAILYHGVLVGWINLDIQRLDSWLSGILSFWLWERFWGNGIMLQAQKAFLKYIFTQTRITDIKAHVFSSNEQSAKLLDWLWFIVSEEDVSLEKDGLPINENIHSLDKVRYERVTYIARNGEKIKNLFINAEDYISDYLWERKWTYVLKLTDWKKIHLRARNEEVSDIDIVSEIFIDNDYDLSRFSELDSPTIVDIWAQIGLFSLYASINLKNPRIFSYEPFPESYSLLKQNSEWGPITHFPTAITWQTWISQLFISDSNVWWHSIIKSNNWDTINIETLSLSDVMKRNKIGKIDLLKIDCEWAEYEIFFWLEYETLSKISSIYMEVHFTPELAKKYKKYAMVDFLRSNWFEVTVLKEFQYEWEGEFYVIFAKYYQ